MNKLVKAGAQDLQELVEPAVVALGYELVHLEFVVHRKGRTLRLYIDAPGGIRVDDCESVSRRVSLLLDVEGRTPLLVAGEYALEVSSPGLDRLLVKRQHFARFLGRWAKVVLYEARRVGDGEGGQRRFVGKLVEAEAEGVVVEVEGERVRFGYDEIEKARLKPEV